MKKHLLLLLVITVFFNFTNAQKTENQVPFSTNNDYLTIYNGTEYLPFFVKGINLGISVPGTFPGELAATSEQYSLWFSQIKDAGFNCIRLYTLHYPRFYDALQTFNQANPQNPLFFFQGVWLNEELDGYEHDLYFMSDTFKVEIEENIDCVHGNRVIEHRYGKAYGTFNTDVSEWNMGYIIGREIYPPEILTTNEENPDINSFTGNHFSIYEATASEAWIAEKLNHLVDYEATNYSTQRPVSISSWPTLDPIHHPEEWNIDEDTAFVDLSKIEIIDAPAGFFISYHAYPYYPDFISEQSSYQEYYDYYGPNSYLGYLIELKSHYENFPLIIAEFGVPSSWGVAHYTSSGMNHGGFDETGQGETDIRLLHTMENALCGGGMQFAWIDEWFKRTWVTDPIDYDPNRRILWHNITAAEQNYGLIGFRMNTDFQNIGDFGEDAEIQNINAGANYDFLEINIGLKNPLENIDEMWISLDTYLEDVGESTLPTGDILQNRSEFALHITNFSATLYVTEAYDLYGIWHGISEPDQLFHTTVTDGADWNIVRWKNNFSDESVQYIGSLQVNRGFQPESSMDAVTIYDDSIKIRIPWSLINVVDPSQMTVFNDDRNTPEVEEYTSDGIAFSVLYKEQLYNSTPRFTWETWNSISPANISETYKTSYWIMQERLHEFNNPAIAVIDSFEFEGTDFPYTVYEEDGVLKNDFDIDGSEMFTLLTENPANGEVDFNSDGSFFYTPDSLFNGIDSFEYCIYDGYNLSTPNIVVISVTGNNNFADIYANNDINEDIVNIYPNPVSDRLTITSKIEISNAILFDMYGKKLTNYSVNNTKAIFDMKAYPPGKYLIAFYIKDKMVMRKLVISR